MIDFYIHTRKDINIINIKELSIGALFNVFIKNQDATVYVEESGKIEGIITFGDLKRHFLEGTKLINRNFSKVFIENIDEIERIFSKSVKIMSVPQINKKGNIVKEYCRVKNKQDRCQISLEILHEIYNELSLIDCSLGEWIVIIANECDYFKLLGKNKKIKVILETEFEELIECFQGEEKLIVDLASSTFGVRKLLYDKYDKKPLIKLDSGGNKRSFKSIYVRKVNYLII